MRDGQKIAVITGVCAAVVGAAGLGAYSLLGGSEVDNGGGSDRLAAAAESEPTSTPTPTIETGPPTPKEVEATAQGFLQAWTAGDIEAAAELTDDRLSAARALRSFRKDARLSKLALTEGTPSGTDVPFTVTTQVTYGEHTSPWTYDSALTVARDTETGETVVEWEPSVLHPKLAEGQSVRTGPYGTTTVKATDRNGIELTAKEHPTLAAVLVDLGKRYGTEAGGQPGVETRIVGADGEPGEKLLKLSESTPGTLRTTLDSDLQKAAEQSVEGLAKAGVAAVKPSTGEILAFANSPAGGHNTALQGSYAPGSTMKIITASMLIDKGLTSSNKQHPCPKYFTYGGWKFQNLNKFEIKNGTFAQSFAASCNTAFISQAPKLADDDLTQQARDVFGIGLNWQVGTTTFDGQVPVQSDAQMAASLIGQGAVRMNPLNMASVSATVKNGVFRQPYLVDPALDNRALAEAPRAMKPTTAKELRYLMNLTATSGTAAKAMAGLSGDMGAKTGSAEVDGQKKPNAWFTAYLGDLAASAVVANSGHGGDNAGPVVRKVLTAGN